MSWKRHVVLYLLIFEEANVLRHITFDGFFLQLSHYCVNDEYLKLTILEPHGYFSASQ